MKFFIVLLAVVAVASAGYIGGGYGGGYGGGHAQSYHVATIAQAPAIPAPHPAPISYKGNEHVNRIHYNGNTNGHPHLVGIEHYVAAAEPAIGVVKVGHGHGHGW
ncbi:uncharacterized protein LOC116842272 isoform X3 [Odontomachus brunneus]|uniref:uncharacterized protein LOC116842272 isoform X3 n=1 Tax=Odontomachus brunneus TaxID=486640 RepID=UPI0013F20706|nr:uncharacterized protein LOC116842272 isoform X3 [Odontomachus brunneus]